MTAVGQDRAVSLPFGRERIVAFALTALAMTVMIWPHLDYVPIWDGRVYANCVMDAAFSGISTESLRCAGHPSQGWALILALPQLLDPGNITLLNATNLELGIVALIAIRVVLARVFPDPAHARALDIVAAASVLQPVVMSTLLQPNVDFGVYVYFFVALAGLLTPGAAGTATAIVGGSLLVFSKETGVAAYGLGAAAALAIEHVRAGVPLRERWRAVARRAASLSAPLLLFATHVMAWNLTHHDSAIWKHTWQRSSADGFNFFDLSEPIFVGYAAGIFVLGFMWIAWLPVVADLVVGLRRTAKRMPSRQVEGADRTVLIAVTLMTAVLTYLLTSFRTWSNLRYFAVLFPLFVMLAYAALVRLNLPPRLRINAMRALVVIFVVANYRSVDPLSQAVYGTFDTGVHRMYRMTSITGEFEGSGRDQLVYNLEFTGYHDVQNALYAQIKPRAATVIGTARHVRWNIWSQLDSKTFARSARRTGVIAPTYADEVDIAARRAPEAWFIDFSNRSDEDHARATLMSQYRLADSLAVTAGGQKLIAYHLVRREGAVLP